MTTVEFKTAFLARFYAEVGVDALGWEDDEISEFLNFAQLTLVINNARAGNLSAISNLINTTSLLTPVEEDEGEYSLDMSPLDFFYLIDGRAVTSSGNYPVERIESEHINAFKSNPYNTSFFRFPRAAQNEENSISIMISNGESFGVGGGVYIRYVKKPTSIDIEGSVTTNLNETLHNEIVDIAVRRAVKVMVQTGQSAQ